MPRVHLREKAVRRAAVEGEARRERRRRDGSTAESVMRQQSSARLLRASVLRRASDMPLRPRRRQRALLLATRHTRQERACAVIMRRIKITARSHSSIIRTAATFVSDVMPVRRRGVDDGYC